MKSVLISIQPKWCEFIASGKKTVEVRKTRPKLETPFKVYIYCTKSRNEALWKYQGEYYYDTQFPNERPNKANGKVIGEFVCDKIECFTTDYRRDGLQTDRMVEASCVDYFDLCEYEENARCLYGWHISNLVIYDKPKELSEFKTPPCERPENACENCKYLEVINTPNYYEVECYRENGVYLTRPPQSWCYVEELE